MRTKTKKEQVTQERTCSIVGAALANVPLDVVMLATMHIILGLTKNMSGCSRCVLNWRYWRKRKEVAKQLTNFGSQLWRPGTMQLSTVHS